MGGRGGEPSLGRLGLGWGRGGVPSRHRKGAELISSGVGRGREAGLMGPLSQAMTVEGTALGLGHWCCLGGPGAARCGHLASELPCGENEIRGCEDRAGPERSWKRGG